MFDIVAHRVEIRCYKKGRPYGSCRVAGRGVASLDIVTTDFNPLKQNATNGVLQKYSTDSFAGFCVSDEMSAVL